MVRRYLGARFRRYRKVVVVVILVIVIVAVRRRRTERRKRWHLEFDRRRIGRFPFVLGRFRLWARCHEHRSAKAIPIIDEILIGQLEERHYEGLCPSNGRDRRGSKLLVTNDTVEVQLAYERYLSNVMVSKESKNKDSRLTMAPFVAFHHWMDVPLVSPSQKASSRTR